MTREYFEQDSCDNQRPSASFYRMSYWLHVTGDNCDYQLKTGSRA